MALMVERIVDGGLHAEVALGGCSRLEPLHLALSPSHDLVGVLGPIILAEPLVMTTGQMEFSERGAVGPQFVGHDQPGCEALLSEQLAQEL
jgi:DNA-binding transcriptional LysR family regulator